MVTTYVTQSVGVDRVVGGRRFVYRSSTYYDDVIVGVTLAEQASVRSWEDENLNRVTVFAEPDDVTSLPVVTSVTYGHLDSADPQPVQDVTLTWRSSF